LRYLNPRIKGEHVRHYVEDRHTWIRVGMALSELGEAGLELWVAWSAESQAKFTEAACREQWASLSPGTGVTLGSLYRAAGMAGWPGWKRR
jgi:hypothetical protein